MVHYFKMNRINCTENGPNEQTNKSMPGNKTVYKQDGCLSIVTV